MCYFLLSLARSLSGRQTVGGLLRCGRLQDARLLLTYALGSAQLYADDRQCFLSSACARLAFLL
jgi:hypothetical protein